MCVSAVSKLPRFLIAPLCVHSCKHMFVQASVGKQHGVDNESSGGARVENESKDRSLCVRACVCVSTCSYRLGPLSAE